MKPLPIKPTSEDFGIPTDKINEYEKLKEDYKKLKQKGSIFEKWNLYYILTFIILGSVYFGIYKPSFDYKLILLIIFIGLLSFVMQLLPLFLMGIFSVIFSPLIDAIAKRFPTKEAKLLKQINEFEQIINGYDDVVKKYNQEIEEYERMYPGIRDIGYDRVQYIKNIEHTIIDKLTTCIDVLEKRTKVAWWHELSPRQFELEVAEWFRRKGYEASATSYVGDGGVDILLKKDSETIFVQCKHYANPVGVAVMRELSGVVHDGEASRGILVCLCAPSQGAKDFAIRNGIEIITAHDLSLASIYTPNYKKEVRYIPEEAYIGSVKPYMYVGDVGVIFNLFHNRKDTTKYLESLAQQGFFATDIRVGKFHYVICSKFIEMNSAGLISYINTEPICASTLF